MHRILQWGDVTFWSERLCSIKGCSYSVSSTPLPTLDNISLIGKNLIILIYTFLLPGLSIIWLYCVSHLNSVNCVSIPCPVLYLLMFLRWSLSVRTITPLLCTLPVLSLSLLFVFWPWLNYSNSRPSFSLPLMLQFLLHSSFFAFQQWTHPVWVPTACLLVLRIRKQGLAQTLQP